MLPINLETAVEQTIDQQLAEEVTDEEVKGVSFSL